jgi:protein NrfC
MSAKKDKKTELPACEGYLRINLRKCAGCMNCMLVCSLAHEGRVNPSLSRIQVIQNPFMPFPNDVTVEQCRQCVDPACVKACPTGALHVDTEQGNLRKRDPEKCVFCMECVKSCPYTPARMVWNFEDPNSLKCDLCADTPFWNEQGGTDGKQACREVCPFDAIEFTREIPIQEGDIGYKYLSPVPLRLGYHNFYIKNSQEEQKEGGLERVAGWGKRIIKKTK